MRLLRQLALTNRLVLGTTVVTLLTVALLTVGFHVFLDRATHADTYRLLRARADAETATVRVTPDGTVRVLDPPSNSLDQGIWVYSRDGRRLDGSSVAGGLRHAIAGLSQTREVRRLETPGFAFLARPVRRRGSNVATVVAAVDLTPFETSERRALLLAMILGLAAVAAAGAAAGVATRVSLGQVRSMARRADDWREHDLTGRFALGQPRDEIGELGATLDRMLARIAEALHDERRLTEEMAHELRTPLTMIRSEAQLGLMDAADAGHDPDPATLRRIVAATQRMERSITTLLEAARARHDEPARADLADVVTEVLRRVPHRRGVTVHGHPEPVEVAAPAEAVVGALTPLVENATHHARRRVEVRVTDRPEGVWVDVVDDGSGVSVEAAERVFAPGHTTRDGGAGLGLPLARRLATSFGGEVRVVPGQRGHFRLVLPAG